MATSNRRTVVHNHGNLKRGGSKTIVSYNNNSVTSIKSVRGSSNNKSGGADNQYSISTWRPDSPQTQTNFNKPQRNSTQSNSDDGGGILLIIGFALIFGVFWLLWKGGVWLYEAIFD